MNKTDLIEVVSEKLGDRRTASLAVEAVVDAITRAVAKGEKVGISGFGVFEKVERAARTARNPTTGEAVRLERTTVPKFRPGQGFKDIVSGAKEVSPVSGDRAVTARAGVPRKAAAGNSPAMARPSARRAPAKTARAAVSTAASRPTAPAKAPARAAVKTPAKAAGSGTRATVKAPAGRTVPAPGAARSAAAAKAPGRAKAVKRT